MFLQDDEHDAEDWERFESLHDDVDKQVNAYIYIACVYVGVHIIYSSFYNNNNRGELGRDCLRRSRRWFGKRVEVDWCSTLMLLIGGA